MLESLHINNYAIIQEMEIHFSPQLNIITGETGAGKSIMMGALSLILGERADTNILNQADKKCIIEGHFNIASNHTLHQLLAQQEIDYDNTLIVRREITPNGKTRAYINDSPVTIAQLKQIGSLLIDLHRQFDTLTLTDEVFQRTVIDTLANNEALLNEYKQNFKQYQNLQHQLAILEAQKTSFQKESDYFQFLFDELAEAAFTENEIENLEDEIKVLNNAESIKVILNSAYFQLKESDAPIVNTLKLLIGKLQPIANISKECSAVVERMQSAYIELNDIATEIDRMNDSIDNDVERIEWIDQRLNLGYKLFKKHAVKDTAGLLQVQNDLEKRLLAVSNIDTSITTLATQLKDTLDLLNKHATTLSAARIKAAKPFVVSVNDLLKKIGMPNAQLKVAIEPIEMNQHGIDQILFLVDTNKTGRFEPINKIASGGELSRLMLCIKSFIAQQVNLPTMIFDEIDTGISGEAARQVGFIMQQMGQTKQIITITHQPQIAAKGNSHFYMYKQEQNKTISTQIKLLTPEERVNTIAQMLAGNQVTAATLATAQDLLNNPTL